MPSDPPPTPSTNDTPKKVSNSRVVESVSLCRTFGSALVTDWEVCGEFAGSVRDAVDQSSLDAPLSPIEPVVILVQPLATYFFGVCTMTTAHDQIIRKTVSLPQSLWKELGNYRFDRRFPTETGALAEVVARGLRAGAVLGAIANIATGRRTGSGKFSAAAVGTMGNTPTVLDLVESDVRDWTVACGLTLPEAEIQNKARQVYNAAEKMAATAAAGGQAAILEIVIEDLIEWALRTA